MTTQNTTAATMYAPIGHPGVPVPAALRPWKAAWPQYQPVDITPPELRPEGLARPAGWIFDTVATPQEVTDWTSRQERAVVPFEVSQGVPLNPSGRTGRTGRNLAKWGESQAADPIVVAGPDHDLRVLLIQRDDVFQWAIPGGMVDPGETAPTSLVRELREETGVDLTYVRPEVLTRTYVTDWRNTDHAWITTTAALYRIPDVIPAVAADDAADAAWWPLSTVEDLAWRLVKHGGLYEAHRPLLEAAAARMGGRL